MRRFFLTVLSLLFFHIASAEVWQIDVMGPIGPATADHVVRNLEAAQGKGIEAVILRMNTPGGLDTSMRDIVQAILGSNIPVIGYVAPEGSRAASAGTYILYACHIAAMAPATSLGAATPVQIGGMSFLPNEEPESSEGKEQKHRAESSQQAMRNKVVNDAVAYIRGLAELRGRNAKWAEKAVSEAATMTVDEALINNVIDFKAETVTALLNMISGKVVTTGTGKIELQTSDAHVVQIKPDWRSEFLSVITNPSVAYILMILGIYGLVLEFSNPGIGAGGIIGGICLFVALYAMQLLPISYSALGLILLGMGLMAAEAFSPSFGILGIGGIAAFIIGSIMLMDTKLQGFQIALPIILAFSVASAGMLIIVLGLLIKARKGPVVSGLGTLIGQQATVVNEHEGKTYIRLQGELWQVDSDSQLKTGDRVQVEQARGVILKVRKEV